MKVLFLHIGDIHIKDRRTINEFQIKKIADSLNSFQYDHIIIVVSGDIAFSGNPDQYAVAKKLIGALIESIKASCGHTKYINVVVVPGNHDVDQTDAQLSSTDLQCIRKNNAFAKCIDEQIKKQKGFIEFANRYNCFVDDPVFHQRIIDIKGFKLEFNLINTGVFSSLEEDKGLHYFPEKCFNTLNTPTGADFVLTIMHHAPDWFTDEQKNRLESIIYSKSSLVYLGHEHYLAQKRISYDDNKEAFIQLGGCLCENENWRDSSFHIGVIDTQNYMYQHAMLVWNHEQNQYEQKDTTKQQLTKKPSQEKRLMISEEFNRFLLSDSKRDLAESFLEYFVFPRLEPENSSNNTPTEYCSEESFLSEIYTKKRVLVLGGYNSGKTCLLKRLFICLNEANLVSLFCKVDDIRGKSVEKVIKNCFREEYGDLESDYNRFLQYPKEKKALLIDDVDQILTTSFNQLVGQLCDEFGLLIFSSRQLIDLNLFDRMKAQLKTADSIYKYKIAPLYADKRKEVIERIVRLKSTDSNRADNIIRVLCEAISSQKSFISLDPDFVIKYVEYFMNNIGDVTANDTGVFNKVFETNIVNSISPYQTSKISVDKVFVLLSKVAHFIHFNKAYPITEKDLFGIIDIYNNEYGSSIKGTDLIGMVTKSRILYFDDSKNGYKFTNKNHLAYFVAREINRNYHDTGDDKDLQKILRDACFGINADVLMFLSYITDNVKILNIILQMANYYAKEWEEFDFTEHLPKFLQGERTHKVSLPPANALEIEEQAEIDAERKAQEQLRVVDIYDYTEEQADELVNRVIRSLQLLIVISRCLPNFEHLMKKNEKKMFVNAIYEIPNKIFNVWAQIADRQVDEIINFFKEQQNDYYIRQKQVNDQDIIRALQWASMSLLLDLYNFPVVLATKEYTSQYLNEFDYSTKETYGIEHLMMLEKQSSSQAFIAEAKRLSNNKRGAFYVAIIRRIVGHAIVFKNELNYSERQQLQAKFFPNNRTEKRFLLERSKNKDKEEKNEVK